MSAFQANDAPDAHTTEIDLTTIAQESHMFRFLYMCTAIGLSENFHGASPKLLHPFNKRTQPGNNQAA
jgi:hypothetical protein